MFKCKITLEEFDKELKTGPKADLPGVKNLAKAAVKKLATAEESKTPFFLSKNYFEDKGKPIGSFLAFGENKKLEMQFAKKEIKGKGSTQDAKGAAYGEAYVKTTNNIQFIYFEPDSACKVPANAWPKLLKSLKPMFGGMKAMVVIDGQSLAEAEDDDNSEDYTNDVEISAPSEPTVFSQQSPESYITNTASGILNQSLSLIKSYNRAGRSNALETSNTWLAEYEKIPVKDRNSELQKTHSKITDANKKLKELEQIEDSIDKAIVPIFKQIDTYLANVDPKGLEMLAKTIKKNLELVVGLTKKVGDTAFQEELNNIIKLLK